jgi:hypothetical protein
VLSGGRHDRPGSYDTLLQLLVVQLLVAALSLATIGPQRRPLEPLLQTVAH